MASFVYDDDSSVLLTASQFNTRYHPKEKTKTSLVSVVISDAAINSIDKLYFTIAQSSPQLLSLQG